MLYKLTSKLLPPFLDYFPFLLSQGPDLIPNTFKLLSSSVTSVSSGCYNHFNSVWQLNHTAPLLLCSHCSHRGGDSSYFYAILPSDDHCAYNEWGFREFLSIWVDHTGKCGHRRSQFYSDWDNFYSEYSVPILQNSMHKPDLGTQSKPM